MGPFKAVFGHKVVFVVPTGGTPEERDAALAHARYDAETLYVRGNGGVDVVTDAELLKGGFERRNVVLYGNADSNRAWTRLMRGSPVVVHRGFVTVGDRKVTGDDLGVLLVRPKPGVPDCLVAALAPHRIGGRGAPRPPRATSPPPSPTPTGRSSVPKDSSARASSATTGPSRPGIAGWNP